jgi:hypothetical protein
MNEIVDFDQKKVIGIFEGMGFDCSLLNTGFVAKQSGYWPVVAILQDKYDELQMYTFLTAKPDVNVNSFLTAINLYNTKASLTCLKLDNEGTPYLIRVLPCKGGFAKQQLIQLIQEGNKEINTFLPLTMVDFIE